MNSQHIAAIILAAGESRRMGQPKMLLPWGKTTVLGQVVAVFAQTGISEILVVTGGARKQVESLVADLAGTFPVRSIHNPGYKAGEMLSSLQRGLAGLKPGMESALIGLGDQPQVELRSVRSILEAYVQSRARVIVPSYQMRRGHPWLVQKSLWEELLAMNPPQTPRDFLNAHAGEIHYVSLDTPTLIADLDTPEDYKCHPGG